MYRRSVLIGLGAMTLTGCASLRKTPVPVAREGFVVREKPVAQSNMTAFLPEGDTIYMSGSINSDTTKGFETVRTAHPDATRLVVLQADGAAGSPEAMAFGRALRSAGFTTHARNDSVITGGAVDAFLGGIHRSVEEGAVIGVVRAQDFEAHKAYSSEMVGGDGFARFAEEFGAKRRPRPMTIAEIGAMGIVSASTGNVIEAN